MLTVTKRELLISLASNYKRNDIDSHELGKRIDELLDEGKRTLKQWLVKVKKLDADIKTFEQSLFTLRHKCPSWESGIENDERNSVKLLYSRLVELRKEWEDLLNFEIIPFDKVCPIPEEMPESTIATNIMDLGL